ncbi:MAG: hypothetical protein HQK84_08820 [Nitrospinae bacterium]|nr:hypothetical protein [Nitrospinota bacterium]
MKRLICALILFTTLFTAPPVFAHTFNDILYLIFNGRDSERVKKIKEEAAKEKAAKEKTTKALSELEALKAAENKEIQQQEVQKRK